MSETNPEDESMNKEEKTRNLIRLKRHETPPEGYFDDFLEEFRNRRDEESPVFSQSKRSEGFISRWWQNRPRVKVVGFGVAYAALVLTIVWWPKGEEGGSDQNRQPVIYEPDPNENPLPGPNGREPKSTRE